MSDKHKITFVIPDALQKEFREKIVKEGYSLRDKSKWVSEAINHLLNLNNYPELVNYGDEMKGFDKTETVVIPDDLKSKLNGAILTIRKQYPTLEGVQSRILRTSILQKLIRT